MSLFARVTAALLILAPAAAQAGPLLDKALAYSDRWVERNSPAFACRVETLYTDETLTEVESYHDLGDSTIWTGNYVAAESYRYAVTGDPQAKINALRSLECLLAMEEVTGKPGFIARWVGPAEPPYLLGECNPAQDCHVVTEGPYAGNFWKGNTSSDQYLGWWYGVSHVWDFVLDGPEDNYYRNAIRGAVTRVVDTLRADDYLITDPDGTVSTAGPEIVGNEAMAFHLVTANIAGGEYAEMLPQVYADNFLDYYFLWIYPITRYFQYYAFHLGHMASHMVMTHETSWPLLAFHRNHHRLRAYAPVAGSGQVMFDYIAMGEKAIAESPALLASARAHLAAIPGPPRLKISNPQGPWTPDPQVDVLNYWGPIIAELLGKPGEWKPQPQQGLAPFPFEERCNEGFRWQRNPYRLCGPDNPRFEYPGEDYLIAYWMGRYYGFLTEED
ncbi:MAG: hypothetical protein K8I02_00080 [Candidatus Methylomirabilis sp.]|nr:hypothetical protein [Deltaproteobacteria bacterium]